MEHLLTIASGGEFSRESAWRWCPREDKEIWDAAMRTGYLGDKEKHEAAALVQVATGLSIGDCGSIYIFICHSCSDFPIQTVFQCS